MAAVGAVLSVAETLFAALESPVIKEICSILGYRSELNNLNNTVSTIRAVLLDAEAKQDHELSNEAKDRIEKLKYAVYDADDILDEFTTLAEQKQLLNGGKSKISNEVRTFFFRFNQLGVAYTMSRGIKKIRKQLDAIGRDHTQFGFSDVNNEPIRCRNRETCSYVCEQNIIGRKDDEKAVIDMLLDPGVEDNVYFVSIVGIGGLGKTSLAQLVYNDEVIKFQFPLRMWVCVSNQDPKNIDIKEVLCKILESATRMNHDKFRLESVQRELQNKLDKERFLLVLDDVWSEDRDECLKLGEILMGGQKRGRILVTTRSKETARVIGNGHVHVLQGLSEQNSRCLFERMAFDQGQAELNPELVEIGREIVKKCANVPLAIRTVGTLLYGQNKSKWLAIQNIGLARIRQGDDGIMHVLKLSYHHLDSHLRSCFCYCANFPKGYVLNKETLINLWMAQGYVEPLEEGQSLDDAGEEYFSILLRRCFFQDIKIDKYGQIKSCKMHDLMHDVAQEVAGKEICEMMSKLDKKARHVYNSSEYCTESSFPKSKIRTYVSGAPSTTFPVDSLLTNWKYLRVLSLTCSGIKCLPPALGRLLHLRYLNLSRNHDLKRLPEQLTKVHTLQTLDLSFCQMLEELPRGLSRLINLRVLDISECDALTFMPCGIDKLTSLTKLSMFVVAKENSSPKQDVGALKDIEALTGLKGHLTIKVLQNAIYNQENGEGGILKNIEYLRDICVRWEDGRIDEISKDCQKALLEDLKPPSKVKELTLDGYHAVSIPSWAREDNLANFVPNLVHITLKHCKGLQCLPSFAKLCFLKSLKVHDLSSLIYMEDTYASSYEASSFFPSLKSLLLSHLPKLRAWWRPSSSSTTTDSRLSSYPCLSDMRIYKCEHITYIPFNPGPGVQHLTLEDSKKRSPKMKVYYYALKGPLLRSNNHGNLRALPMEAFRNLSQINIHGDHKLESLLEIKDVFQSCSSSLRTLVIRQCYKLKTLSGEVLEQLTSLESLLLYSNKNLKSLPECIGCLSSLKRLTLCECPKLKLLPGGIRVLTSLRDLLIAGCSTNIKLRCQEPDGEDWPKIQHITNISIIE